jgi:hypothetical protein
MTPVSLTLVSIIAKGFKIAQLTALREENRESLLWPKGSRSGALKIDFP